MKKIFLFIGMLSCGLTFGQSNSSLGGLSGLAPAFSGEIFRFQPGAATQLDAGTTNFTFGTTDRWFSHGRVNAGTQSFYGSRIQHNNSALVMGYGVPSGNLNTSTNPVIQWIGQSEGSMGNLEFRRGAGFGSSSGPGTNLLVASMTPLGNTIFGNTSTAVSVPIDLLANQSNSAKLNVLQNGVKGMEVFGRAFNTVVAQEEEHYGIFVNAPDGGFGAGSRDIGVGVNLGTNDVRGVGGRFIVSSAETRGLQVEAIGQNFSYGLEAASSSPNLSIGVIGRTVGNSTTRVGIYGESPFASNSFAGYFNGQMLTTNISLISDGKLKENVSNESNMLNQIMRLRPVNYSFKETPGLNTPDNLQHGFISQEMAEVFPELTQDVVQPVFDENGAPVSEISFKSINYIGLISVLTSAMQEMNTELNREIEVLREELADYKANDNVRSSLMQENQDNRGYFMDQNVPNPFEDKTVIRYQLAPGVSNASITVFDLNGRLVKDYPINQNAGELVISALEIGKGMFIYSLTQGGREMLTKKMIVK